MSQTIVLPAPRREVDGSGAPPVPVHHPGRWRLSRAGIVNVWYYYEQRFDLSGGRLILRGSNGSGKSRALEMLLPFVLDADRRRMDASGAGKVRLEDLMRAGGQDQNVRLGYVWVELVRAVALRGVGVREAAPELEYRTVGAAVRFTKSTAEAKAWYFLTPQRIDHELVLMAADRSPLSVHQLTLQLGEDQVTAVPEVHRERVAREVFGLRGPAGRERFAGLLQLLHTLRAPDVGNRIDEGGLPKILSEALPPLADKALLAAGEKLDGLLETRRAQDQLESAWRHVAQFAAVYRRYATGVLRDQAERVRHDAQVAQEAAQDSARCRQSHLPLEDESANAAERREELEGLCEELAATIAGIKESRAYQDARELDERQGRLEALATAADAALSAAAAARAAEQGAVDAADEAAGDIKAAAAQADLLLEQVRADLHAARLNPAFPARLAVQAERPVAVSEPVRTSRAADPAAAPRPVALQLRPGEEELGRACQEWTGHADKVLAAASARRDQAESRRMQARRLADELAPVEQQEALAQEAAREAVAAEEDARAAAGRRDDAALALAEAWTAWSRSRATCSLLGEVDWGTGPVGTLLAEPGALVGDAGEGEEAEHALARLDAAGSWAAGRARERHAAARAALTAADEAAGERMRALEEESQELQVLDPPPPTPAWQAAAPAGAVPLWKALDFAEQVGEADRVGLEGALLASGLLTAALHRDGSVRADDGQVLLAADGPQALRSARQVLVPAPDAGVPAVRVQAVLDRIALDVPGPAAWISRSGEWGNGLLHGCHRPAVARHIGTAARAAAREQRQAEIADELDTLEQACQERAGQREETDRAARAVEEHLLTAPRATMLAAGRREAVRTHVAAERARHRASRLAAEAGQARRTWQAERSAHQDACAAFDLPDAHDELLAARDSAAVAMAGAAALRRGTAAVAERLARHGRALRAVADARGARRASEDQAQLRWAVWSGEDAALAAVRESLGATAEKVTAHLAMAQQAHGRAKLDLGAAGRAVTELAARAATAAAQAQTAAARVVETEARLEEAVQALVQRGSHRALACARHGGAPPVQAPAGPLTAATAESLAREVLGSLLDRSATADATAVLRAQSVLERALDGVYDVVPGVEDDVQVVELCDAGGRRWVGDAEAELKDLRDRGRGALSERERAAFNDFVLGGVAQELSERVTQAERLVRAMNDSLKTISTSHGIGVRLQWTLTEPDGPEARIKDLVALDPAVMRPDQAEELITLLREQVDARFTQAPDAGYAAHLRAAFDYRAWHTMEVVITGPEPNQQRKISRRAKLSQGETRFVSYVTLFAAADAYLSGLPDTEHALRLILLDDAFAKVDERTIGELMDLLVRLDLDFAMTGHALWGFYAQVPALDVYEVRRAEGTAAVTVHVHWDGSNRHLRATT